MNITSALNAALECVASMATATEHRESTIRELQRTIEDRNTTIYTAKRVNDTLSSEVATKDATIRELKSKGRSHDAQCSKNTTAIGMIHDLHDTIDELEAKNSDKANTITKLEQEIDLMHDKIRELRKEAKQESPEEIRLHQTIKELQSRNDAQAVDISKLKSKVSKLEEDVASKHTQMLGMSNTMQLQADELAVLTGKRNSDALKIKELSEECNSLNNANKSHHLTISERNITIFELRKELAILKNKEQQEGRRHRENLENQGNERVACILKCTQEYKSQGSMIPLMRNLRDVTGLGLADSLVAAKHMVAGGKFVTVANLSRIDTSIMVQE